MRFKKTVTDGVHEMSFAEADAAVDEKRVVLGARVGRNLRSRRKGELVGATQHQIFKREVGKKPRLFGRIDGGSGRRNRIGGRRFRRLFYRPGDVDVASRDLVDDAGNCLAVGFLRHAGLLA